uniref:hypothetical protein n=1 Tax=Marinobacterium profundum TaxID=1714300 RepID=UPI00082FE099|nr:hypothetical protein [Marinobacterium profundum]
MDRIVNIHILTKRLIVMTLICVMVFGAIFGLSYFFSQRFMMTWAGFLCGIVGGFVSIQQRIKTVSDEELELLTKSWFQILLVPVFGGVFSLVLYCLFLSGIVSGTLFPAFYIPEPSNSIPDSGFMIDLFTKTYPLTGQDFAKFLFWSFVAGFSERFVPQIISNVVNKASEKDSEVDR